MWATARRDRCLQRPGGRPVLTTARGKGLERWQLPNVLFSLRKHLLILLKLLFVGKVASCTLFQGWSTKNPYNSFYGWGKWKKNKRITSFFQVLEYQHSSKAKTQILTATDFFFGYKLARFLPRCCEGFCRVEAVRKQGLCRVVRQIMFNPPARPTATDGIDQRNLSIVGRNCGRILLSKIPQGQRSSLCIPNGEGLLLYYCTGYSIYCTVDLTHWK